MNWVTRKRQRLAEWEVEEVGQQENKNETDHDTGPDRNKNDRARPRIDLIKIKTEPAAPSPPAASEKDASSINMDCVKYWRLRCLVCKVNRRDTSLLHAIICEPCFLGQARNSEAAASSSHHGVEERSLMPIDYTKTLACGLECDTRMTRKGSNARFVCLRPCFRDSGHSGACRCSLHSWLSVDMDAVDESMAEVGESDEEGYLELDDGGNEEGQRGNTQDN